MKGENGSTDKKESPSALAVNAVFNHKNASFGCVQGDEKNFEYLITYPMLLKLKSFQKSE